MEYLSNIVISFLLIWIFAVSTTTAHYCVWGLCESWEYCCDENVCCSSKDYDIWITLVIIAGIVIGMVVAGTCLYYNIRRIYLYLQRRYHGINSVSMPAEFEPDGRSIKMGIRESKESKMNLCSESALDLFREGSSVLSRVSIL